MRAPAAQHPLHRALSGGIGCDDHNRKKGTLIGEKITGKIYWATFSPAFCWTVIGSSVGTGGNAFFHTPCHRELIKRGDRVHAHHQSLGRGVSADAFGELCWLPD